MVARCPILLAEEIQKLAKRYWENHTHTHARTHTHTHTSKSKKIWNNFGNFGLQIRVEKLDPFAAVLLN